MPNNIINKVVVTDDCKVSFNLFRSQKGRILEDIYNSISAFGNIILVNLFIYDSEKKELAKYLDYSRNSLLWGEIKLKLIENIFSKGYTFFEVNDNIL